MSILILEGCDAVGKDTFAKILSKKTGYEIVRGSSFEISELGSDEMFRFSMELFDRKNIILNRSFYSNLVYGKLFNYPMMSSEQYDELVYKLDEKRAIVVYLHAPQGVIEYRLDSRGDDAIKSKDVESIINKYKDVMYGDFRPSFMLSIDSSATYFEYEANIIKKILS